jgi:hypothetical protein
MSVEFNEPLLQTAFLKARNWINSKQNITVNHCLVYQLLGGIWHVELLYTED